MRNDFCPRCENDALSAPTSSGGRVCDLCCYILLPGTVKPSAIPIIGGSIPDTLGRLEWEQGAALIVRFYQTHGDAFAPVKMRAIAKWLEHDIDVGRWARVPIWAPSLPTTMRELGLVFGWENHESEGEPTPLFLELITHPRRWRELPRLDRGGYARRFSGAF